MAKVKGSIPFMGLDVDKESGAVTLRFAKRFAQLVDIRVDFVLRGVTFRFEVDGTEAEANVYDLSCVYVSPPVELRND